MKSGISFIFCFIAVSAFAQNKYNTVTINYNGQNRQVFIDGKLYTPSATSQYASSTAQYDSSNDNNNSTYNFKVVTNDVAPGRHVLLLKRDNNRRNIETSFNTRNNYDLAITVDRDGSVQLKETYKKGTAAGTGRVPMSTASYNTIVRAVRNTSQASAKVNVLNEAFAKTTNFYTTSQARKLILLINGESARLQLAKFAVRGITDNRNIYSLNSLFANQASRYELAEYIKNYNALQTSGTITPITKTPMAEAKFNLLLNDIRNRWQPGAKMTAVSNAFIATDNFFTTAQAIQLIQLLSSESERLQLAKASYRTIVDTLNFIQVSELLGTQSSRDELAFFVRSNGSNTGSNISATNNKTAMSDINFNNLHERIREQWIPGVKKNEVLNAFANTNNYFSTYQVSQLVQLDSDEPDRLDMAKASLRSITDPENIALLNNVFITQQIRDEFTAYVRNYRNTNTSTTSSPGTNVSRTPMTDANFTVFLNETKRLWLPGAKKATILEAFSTPNNYFTTLQAMQLIQLDNDEPDRLDMAKAGYQKIVDPQNFTQVYSLFNNQVYIDELTAYVRSTNR